MVQKGIRLAASKLQFIIIIKSMALFFLPPHTNVAGSLFGYKRIQHPGLPN